MAVRIREDGTIWCAAMHSAMPGDTYLNDGLHYRLSVELQVLVTDFSHNSHGQWWWVNSVPPGIQIDRWWER